MSQNNGILSCIQEHSQLIHLLNYLDNKKAYEIEECEMEIIIKCSLHIKNNGQYADLLQMSFNKGCKLIKQTLYDLQLAEYYENVKYIYYKITNKQPPTLSLKMEEKLKNMFREMRSVYAKYFPDNKFINYNYIFSKMLKILGEYELANQITILYSALELEEADSIWKIICKELNWQFYTSFE